MTQRKPPDARTTEDGRRIIPFKRPTSLGTRNSVRLVTASVKSRQDIEQGENEVAYAARVLVQATLPHSRTTELLHRRTNGSLTVEIFGHPSHGLPYGTYPRILLYWVAGEVVRKKSPVLEPGDTLGSFLEVLGLGVTGGRKGTITTLRRQFDKLFHANIAWSYTDAAAGRGVDGGFRLFEHRELWWDPHSVDQRDLFKSTIVLGERFFRELLAHNVPLDVAVLRELARERSPMALDQYAWLTHRMSYLHESQFIGWDDLELQFGADYGSRDDFRKAFLEKLMNRVLRLYDRAKVEVVRGGLVLSPSPTHVPRLKR